VKGAIDSGLKIPCSPEVLPHDDRIKGQHIAKYANTKGHQNSNYAKAGVDVKDFSKYFESVKEQIK